MREDTLIHLRPLASSRRSPDEMLRVVPLKHDRDHILEGILIAECGDWWWIYGGVPRMLPAALYRNPDLETRYGSTLRGLGLTPHSVRSGQDRSLERLQTRTIDRFGAEWLRFREWGFYESKPEYQTARFRGGLWENTLSAFRSKTFLAGQISGKLCLDAGSGNGRFTAAALHEGAREVLAVDLGWGVDATIARFASDPRVHVIQGSLFDLPVGQVDVAFSIGVLMHTGDAQRAFAEIARVTSEGGLFAVRMYHRGNGAYEFLDRSIRAVSTRLPQAGQLGFARLMQGYGIIVSGLDKLFPKLHIRSRCYQILHHWPTLHHNVDWWSAPIATHHTVKEVLEWAGACALGREECDPSAERSEYGFWEWPESLTVLLRKLPADVLQSKNFQATMPTLFDAAEAEIEEVAA